MTLAIIDDEEINHFIIKRMVDKIAGKISILSFYEVDKALEFIDANKNQLENLPGFIFLDINMPRLDGWSFIEQLEKVKGETYHPTIYILSSSVHQADLDRAKSSTYVQGYFNKPISQKTLNDILK